MLRALRVLDPRKVQRDEEKDAAMKRLADLERRAERARFLRAERRSYRRPT